MSKMFETEIRSSQERAALLQKVREVAQQKAAVDDEAALHMELLAETDAKLDRINARLDRVTAQMGRLNDAFQHTGTRDQHAAASPSGGAGRFVTFCTLLLLGAAAGAAYIDWQYTRGFPGFLGSGAVDALDEGVSTHSMVGMQQPEPPPEYFTLSMPLRLDSDKPPIAHEPMVTGLGNPERSDTTIEPLTSLQVEKLFVPIQRAAETSLSLASTQSESAKQSPKASQAIVSPGGLNEVSVASQSATGRTRDIVVATQHPAAERTDGEPAKDSSAEAAVIIQSVDGHLHI